LELHLMNTTVTEVEAVRSVRFDEVTGRRTFRLPGPMTFASAEQVLRRLAEIPAGPGAAPLDLRRVASVSASARRTLREAMTRLSADGHVVGLADPGRRLPRPDLGDGTRPVNRRAAR